MTRLVSDLNLWHWTDGFVILIMYHMNSEARRRTQWTKLPTWPSALRQNLKNRGFEYSSLYSLYSSWCLLAGSQCHWLWCFSASKAVGVSHRAACLTMIDSWTVWCRRVGCWWVWCWRVWVCASRQGRPAGSDSAHLTETDAVRWSTPEPRCRFQTASDQLRPPPSELSHQPHSDSTQTHTSWSQMTGTHFEVHDEESLCMLPWRRVWKGFWRCWCQWWCFQTPEL